MHQLVYVSAASWAMSNAELNEILDVSRRNNRQSGVTGMLLHLDRGFLQVLEGPKRPSRKLLPASGATGDTTVCAS